MKKLVAFVFVAAVLGFSPLAGAASVSFDLNCLWNGTNCSLAQTSYGTVTLTDSTSNSKWVDVSVTLDNGNYDITHVYLNWTGTPDSSYNWYLDDGVGSNVGYSSDGSGPDGKLDLDLTTGGWKPSNIWSGTLELRKGNWLSGYSYQDLSASDFNVADASGYWTFVTANVRRDGNVTLGSKVPPPPPTVPEPASMTLLGTGLIGLAGAVRRRLRK